MKLILRLCSFHLLLDKAVILVGLFKRGHSTLPSIATPLRKKKKNLKTYDGAIYISEMGGLWKVEYAH